MILLGALITILLTALVPIPIVSGYRSSLCSTDNHLFAQATELCALSLYQNLLLATPEKQTGVSTFVAL